MEYDEALHKIPPHARVVAARARNAAVKGAALRAEADENSVIVSDAVRTLAARYKVSSYLIADLLSISRTRVKQILAKSGITPADVQGKHGAKRTRSA